MNARQLANLAYTLLIEGLDGEQIAQTDARLYEGALDDMWQEGDD